VNPGHETRVIDGSKKGGRGTKVVCASCLRVMLAPHVLSSVSESMWYSKLKTVYSIVRCWGRSLFPRQLIHTVCARRRVRCKLTSMIVCILSTYTMSMWPAMGSTSESATTIIEWKELTGLYIHGLSRSHKGSRCSHCPTPLLFFLPQPASLHPAPRLYCSLWVLPLSR